jgi:hypothetical protein
LLTCADVDAPSGIHQANVFDVADRDAGDADLRAFDDAAHVFHDDVDEVTVGVRPVLIDDAKDQEGG